MEDAGLSEFEDVLKGNELVVLGRYGAARGGVGPILCDEETAGKRGPEARRSCVYAVGVRSTVRVASMSHREGSQVGVASLTPVAGVGAISLARGEKVPCPVGAVCDRQAFHIGDKMSLRASRVDEVPVESRVGFGRVLPDPHILLGEVEVSHLVVCNAALGLRADAEDADLLRGDLSASVVRKFPLLHVAIQAPDRVPTGDEDVKFAARLASIHAQPVGFVGSSDRTHRSSKRAGCRVDAVEHDTPVVLGLGARVVFRPVARRYERNALASEREVGAKIDVVVLCGLVAVLKLRAGQVIDSDPAQLVRSNDRAARGVRWIDPDGCIIGGITAVRNGCSLRRRDDGVHPTACRRAERGDEDGRQEYGELPSQAFAFFILGLVPDLTTANPIETSAPGSCSSVSAPLGG